MLIEALVFIAAALSIAFLVLYSIGGNAAYQGQSAFYNLSQEGNVVLPRSVYLGHQNPLLSDLEFT